MIVVESTTTNVVEVVSQGPQGPAGSGALNSFSTFAVSGQSSVVADSSTDILTLNAGAYIAISTDAATDTITIATSGVQKAISYGTAAPSGGNEGDIYLQHT